MNFGFSNKRYIHNDVRKSPNEISIWNWLLTREDHYSGVVVAFRSRRSLGSPRYRPLFSNSSKIRVVVITGLPIPKSDLLLLKTVRHIERLMRRKLSKYEWYHSFNSINFIATNQFIHIDDPEYSEEEINRITSMQLFLESRSKILKVVVTNEYSKRWFQSRIPNLQILILSQGFTEVSDSQEKKSDAFICVYSSPYIDFIGDKHENHSTRGARLLIAEIIPDLLKRDPLIEIHLIGQLGKHAKAEVLVKK